MSKLILSMGTGVLTPNLQLGYEDNEPFVQDSIFRGHKSSEGLCLEKRLFFWKDGAYLKLNKVRKRNHHFLRIKNRAI